MTENQRRHVDNDIDDDDEIYMIGEHVLVFYGCQLFDATVLDIDLDDNDPYFVHFHGWNKRYDLWVPKPHMVKLTPDTRLQQQELLFDFNEHKKRLDNNKIVKRRQQAKESRKRKSSMKSLPKKPTQPKKKKADLPQRNQTKYEIPSLIAGILRRILGQKDQGVYATARVVEMQAHECCNYFSTTKDGKLTKEDMKKILLTLGATNKKQFNMVWTALSKGDSIICSLHFVNNFRQQRQNSSKRYKPDVSKNEIGMIKIDESKFKEVNVEVEKKKQTKQSRGRAKKDEKKTQKDQKRSRKKSEEVKDEKQKSSNTHQQKNDADLKRYIVSWFERQANKDIQTIAKDVSHLSVEAILEVEKADWQKMTQNILAGSAIYTFLRKLK